MYFILWLKSKKLPVDNKQGEVEERCRVGWNSRTFLCFWRSSSHYLCVWGLVHWRLELRGSKGTSSGERFSLKWQGQLLVLLGQGAQSDTTSPKSPGELHNDRKKPAVQSWQQGEVLSAILNVLQVDGQRAQGSSSSQPTSISCKQELPEDHVESQVDQANPERW